MRRITARASAETADVPRPAADGSPRGPALALSHRITHRKILRVLAAGFSLVFVLLVASAVVSVVNVRSINSSASTLVQEQLVTARLIQEIQHEQIALSAILHKLARETETLDRDQILQQLDDADEAIENTVAMAAAAGSPEEKLWEDLERAVTEFSAEARHYIEEQNVQEMPSRTLFQRHETALSLVSKLISAGYGRASTEQQQIARRSRDLLQQSFALLGACVALALIFAFITVRIATELFRRMEWQAGELSRVSWYMLEKQESTARRFSHELHDELGQALTALKANMLALDPASDASRARREDCLRLVDDAIGNVRELSQLLRPTILDDFGLDASLRWLAEGFHRRTGIEIDYESNFSGRLQEDLETHLFRIAQEALTNVARHSGASAVTIRLNMLDSDIRLSVSDNGKGISDAAGDHGGMGMIGMRARARGAGGELTIGSGSRGGVSIDVRMPARLEKRDEAEDTRVASR